MATRHSEGDNPEANAATGSKFTITDQKLYVPTVTLSIDDDNILLQQLKRGFIGTIKCNKYGSEMTKRMDKTNNLNSLFAPTFSKVSKLFVLSFEKKEYL